MRGKLTGIVAAVVLVACADEAERPAAAPYPDREEPRLVEAGGFPLVEYATPRETLFVRDRRPQGDVHLLFFRGQGVSRDAEGRAYVPDAAASRVLVLGLRLEVVRTVGGPSESEGGLGLPLSVAPTPDGGTFVVDVEHPDGLVFYGPAGVQAGSVSPPVPNPNLAAGGVAGLWAARSPYIFGFDPTEPGDPLLYRFDPLAGEGVGIAEIEPIEAPAWNRLANAGAVASGRDGTGFFAFLVRNELRAYGPDGELLWRARRILHFPTPPPGVDEGEGEVRIRFRPVTQALAVGPEGRLYALTATDEPAAPPSAAAAPPGGPAAPPGAAAATASGAADLPEPEGGGRPAGEDAATEHWRRLEVYDPASGALLRASRVPAAWTTFAVDSGGRVYRVDAERILRAAPPPSRAPLPQVTLEGFDGEATSFAAYRGKALLINFWASWCEPCKRELPELEAYYAGLDHDRVEFLGISVDTNEGAARRFAAGFGLSFPLFLGRGGMRDSFRFYGLPYTIIADYRGRIVGEFLGFGNPATWRRLTTVLEEEIARASPGPSEEHPGDPHADSHADPHAAHLGRGEGGASGSRRAHETP